MSMDQPLRILLLDDDAGDAERLTPQLQQAGMNAVIQRVDARDAYILALRHFGPDVVLTRPSASTLCALAALEILRTMKPSAAFIVLSDSLEESAVVASLRAGADGIVSRRRPEQLAPAIVAAVALHRPLERLSPRQIQVMRLIAQGQSTPQIASNLKLSVKTVESHRTQVMNRLGIHDVATLVRYAVRVGLVLSLVVATANRSSSISQVITLSQVIIL